MSLVYTTHDLGPLFWHQIGLRKNSSIFHMFESHEPDPPYRWSKSLIIRLPFSTKGIVIGWWRKTDRTEEEAILAGMVGRDMTYKDLVQEKKDNPADSGILIAKAVEYDI